MKYNVIIAGYHLYYTQSFIYAYYDRPFITKELVAGMLYSEEYRHLVQKNDLNYVHYEV